MGCIAPSSIGLRLCRHLTSSADSMSHIEFKIYTFSNSVNCKVRLPCQFNIRAYRLVGIAAASNDPSGRVFCLRYTSSNDIQVYKFVG